MVKAYAVIGANYGDEGKGLVANALCREAFLKHNKALNVLTNGGPQRGHTAYDAEGRRHVFSHFGAGYAYADIYFSKFYMVNPMTFFMEYRKLQACGMKMNRIFIDRDTTITTPWDMLINRMLESRRCGARHGSCGYGIWETVRRNRYFPLFWKDFIGKNYLEIEELLKKLRDTYFKCILDEYKINLDADEWQVWYGDGLVKNFAVDIVGMMGIVGVSDYEVLARQYERVIFENGQGLLLDDDVDPWGTPTKTDLTYVKKIVNGAEVIPYYVTRSYLTKHGNGHFDGECAKEDINGSMVDLTNHPNEYQGTLRYGKFDETRARELKMRIEADAQGAPYKIVVTHCNEFECPYLDFGDFFSYNEIDLGKEKNNLTF